MNPFRYERSASVADAIAAIAIASDDSEIDARPAPRYLAGGTNLLDLMKANLARPVALVDIRRLPLDEIEDDGDGGLRLGALATNARTANDPLVRERFPLLHAAILAGASPQIRNVATNGGNLLQRTRCHYFYDDGVPCNKREPGSGCPAASGLARQHAILGASEHCVATHPSDMCVALAALDATVHVESIRGKREIPFAEFHRLPGDRPDIDTTLRRDELITHLSLPAGPFARHSTYLKIRERASYAFALVSVAAALDLAEDGTVREGRIALGGVAHRPWRDPQAEAMLAGKPANAQHFGEAARWLLRDARSWGGPALPESLPGNSFKILLAERAIVRALEMATAGILTNTGEDAFRQGLDT
ncbi:FAD-binding molybdopterin dehydrogenase [Cupriavidus sp. TA19]|uniref:FAD binding domain-containing protein n=1 Tax=unclassified Cupriavidus TaxID=2640874 RepID=UPI000E2EFFCD|nr:MULTISPECIES: xanthine dehydrogenase family protein subunit M [unclassified Cupriavidus]BDB28740.1 xanthine dehydrogenase family protein subunit M [Cupriavidus sp. P-10]GLC92889.1 FAD-binding molybdopterin dehydrogenase [Cupriavidus sp. TA19]